LFTALDIIPIRIFGDPAEVPNQADAHTEHSMCSFARSCFDLALKGRYDCLDGFVMPHACDISEKMFEHWSYFKPEMFAYYVMVPHTDRSSSVEQYYAELRRMKTAMEKFAGMEISGDKLVEAVKMHNENRALLRELYSYRKTEIPLISGTDIKQVILACTCLPVQEANELLREVITEVSVQTNGREKILPRIMVYGTPMNSDFIDLIEECGADVVIDDLCVGTRFFWHDVKSTDDPLAGLADRYLTKIKCPRLYRKMPGEYNYEADMEYRFGYLKEFAREWKADGIVSYILRYCDSHQFEIPDIRDYLKKSNYPLLILDGDYKIASEQLKTRIQAFLEMIEYQKGGMSNE
jgi:benzoyl-CoA reductase/2-hydroxyglutaryl-CoA dehydratase subunit BcrC/BadD/HgdB